MLGIDRDVLDFFQTDPAGRTASTRRCERPSIMPRSGTLSARVQREANVLAYIDGFWLCFWLAMAALLLVALITRAPPGPFTPESFGFAKNLLRKCGVTVS